jgi:hypothetical protein
MKRAMFLAAIACLAMLALPAGASAGVWHIDKAPLAFSGTGGEGKITTLPAGLTIDCTSKTMIGEYETTTTGWVEFAYHGCTTTTLFNPPCTTLGQSNGTIKTTKLTFHNVLLTGNKVGILITPNHATGIYAHYACPGAQITISGNGALGEVNKNCGDKAASTTLTFASIEPGVPAHTQVTGKGTIYRLQSSTNGGPFVNWSEDAAATTAFAEGVEPTITCTV